MLPDSLHLTILGEMAEMKHLSVMHTVITPKKQIVSQEKYFTFQPSTKFHAMSPFCLRSFVMGPCAPNHTVQNQAYVTKLLDPRPGMLTWANLSLPGNI